MATKLKGLRVTRVDLVDAGANIDKDSGDGAHILLYKRADSNEGDLDSYPLLTEDEEVAKKQMSRAEINNLADSDFALILPGGAKDADGRTVPRSLRKFPIHDAAHIRNALARLPQSNLSAEDKTKAKKKIDAAARKAGIGEANKMDQSFIRRVATAIGKQFKWSDEEVQKFAGEMAMPPSEPAAIATTFEEEVTEQELRHELNEVWHLFDALMESLGSIMRDPQADKSQMFATSIQQYLDVMAKELEEIAAGGDDVGKRGAKISAARLKNLKDAHKKLSDVIAEQERADGKPGDGKDTKGKDGPKKSEPATKRADGGTMAEPTQATKPEDVLKSASPEVQALIAKMQADIESVKKDAETNKLEAESAKAIAKAEQDKRELSEFTEVAKSEWSHLTGEVKTKAPILRKIASMADAARVEKGSFAFTTEEATELRRMMKAANEAVMQGGLFKSNGVVATGDAGDAFAKIDAIAQEMIAKGEVKTKPQAIDAAMKRYPDLARQYQAEHATH